MKGKKMKKSEIGAFCETYGATIENRMLEHLLENQDLMSFWAIWQKN